MISRHVFGSVEVFSIPLVPRGDATAREVERRAVASLARHAFGPDAAIGHYPDGAPYIVGKPEAHISVSHCRRMAVLAVAQHPVGIDVEEQREALMRVAARFLTPAELAEYSSEARLLEAWTLKEAAYKALRPGTPATRMPLPPAELPYRIVHTGAHPADSEVFMAITEA